MNDLEYIIWFLLNEKKFEIELRPPTKDVASVGLVLKYWYDGKLYSLLQFKHADDPRKMHDFILLSSMKFEAQLKEKGVRK